MSKRSKKKPENFCWNDCPDYPRCYGCECFTACDLCDTPLCLYEAAPEHNEFGWLCRECYNILEATSASVCQGGAGR